MGNLHFSVLFLSAFCSAVWAVPIGDAIRLYDEVNEGVSLAGVVPLSCVPAREVAGDGTMCKDFWKKACESTDNTVDDTDSGNHKVFDAYEKGLDTFFTESGLHTRLNEKIAASNAGLKKNLFTNKLSSTVEKFQKKYCNGKADNETNRQQVYVAMSNGFRNTADPIFNPDTFQRMQIHYMNDIKERCQILCTKTGKKLSDCSNQCDKKADSIDALAISQNVPSSIPTSQSMAYTANKMIKGPFKYMQDHKFPLTEMCQQAAQTFTNVYDSFYKENLKTKWATASPTVKRNVAAKLNEEIFPQDFRDKAESLTGSIKDQALTYFTKINGGTLPDGMKSQITGIQVKWEMPTDLDKMNRRALDQNAAHYDADNTIRFDGGIKKFDGMKMAFVLAHEVGHALHKGAGTHPHSQGLTLNPSVGDVTTCLKKGMIMNRKTNVIQTGMGMQTNQAGECMADYYATEMFYNMLQTMKPALTAAEKRKAVAKTIMNCSVTGGATGIGGDEHPSWKDRSEKIIMANPSMRKLFGCSTDKKDDPYYCPTGAP